MKKASRLDEGDQGPGIAAMAPGPQVAGLDDIRRSRARRVLSAPKQSRRTLLVEGAASTGDRWLAAFREGLRKEGRAAAGGWPGTLGEARARVEAYLAPELSRRKMLSLTREELDWATRTAYARAKRGWLSSCEPEAPESR